MYEPSEDSNYPRGVNENLYSRVALYYSKMDKYDSVFDIKDSELVELVRDYERDNLDGKVDLSEVLKIVKIYILIIDNEKNNKESGR